jgi:predicted DNA-binding protein
MLKSHEQALLGARIPIQLKERLLRFCLSHGIKMNYFVSEAIKEKLQEILEERELTVIAKERLKSAKFISQKELNRYLSKRGIKPF